MTRKPRCQYWFCLCGLCDFRPTKFQLANVQLPMNRCLKMKLTLLFPINCPHFEEGSGLCSCFYTQPCCTGGTGRCLWGRIAFVYSVAGRHDSGIHASCFENDGVPPKLTSLSLLIASLRSWGTLITSFFLSLESLLPFSAPCLPPSLHTHAQIPPPNVAFCSDHSQILSLSWFPNAN